MTLERKTDTPKLKNPDDLKKQDALYFFVKCYMQDGKHGVDFLKIYEAVSKVGSVLLDSRLFTFIAHSNGIENSRIQASESPEKGLPAVMLYPWRGFLSWNDKLKDLFKAGKDEPKMLESEYQRHSRHVPTEMHKYFNSQPNCYRIPTVEILMKISDLSPQLFYEKDDRVNPKRRAALSEFFIGQSVTEHGFFPPPLIELIGSYAFEPSSLAPLIEAFLDSKMDAKGNCSLTLKDFLEIEKILHPEIIPKPEQTSGPKSSCGS